MFCIILLAVSEYIHTNRSIDESVTLKEKVTDTLPTASLYSYSMVTLFLSMTVNRGEVPQILRIFSEIDQLFSSKLYRIQIYKNTRLFLIVQFALIIKVIIIIYAFGMQVTNDNFEYSNIYVIITEIMSLFLNCTAILRFLNLVLLLGKKYKYLNLYWNCQHT
jgi:hypothetical protein